MCWRIQRAWRQRNGLIGGSRVERTITVAAVQLGPIPNDVERPATVDRLVALLDSAAESGAELIVFPELALTSFFPHWLITNKDELRSYFEEEMPTNGVLPLFQAAKRHGVAFVLGYAERTPEERFFNSSIFVNESGRILQKYRKIHLPGFREPRVGDPHQNLEKMYFEVGDLGFEVSPWHQTRVGLAICNDRRWAESYRVLALKGAELVCIGYNTPVHSPHLPETDRLADFHNHLSMQAGAYQNGLWVIGAAKAGVEEGVDQIGGSAIISPSGELVACAETKGDEVVLAEIDLDMSTRYRRDNFNFSHHRRPEHYGVITEPIQSEDF